MKTGFQKLFLVFLNSFLVLNLIGQSPIKPVYYVLPGETESILVDKNNGLYGYYEMATAGQIETSKSSNQPLRYLFYQINPQSTSSIFSIEDTIFLKYQSDSRAQFDNNKSVPSPKTKYTFDFKDNFLVARSTTYENYRTNFNLSGAYVLNPFQKESRNIDWEFNFEKSLDYPLALKFFNPDPLDSELLTYFQYLNGEYCELYQDKIQCNNLKDYDCELKEYLNYLLFQNNQMYYVYLPQQMHPDTSRISTIRKSLAQIHFNPESVISNVRSHYFDSDSTGGHYVSLLKENRNYGGRVSQKMFWVITPALNNVYGESLKVDLPDSIVSFLDQKGTIQLCSDLQHYVLDTKLSPIADTLFGFINFEKYPGGKTFPVYYRYNFKGQFSKRFLRTGGSNTRQISALNSYRFPYLINSIGNVFAMDTIVYDQISKLNQLKLFQWNNKGSSIKNTVIDLPFGWTADHWVQLKDELVVYASFDENLDKMIQQLNATKSRDFMANGLVIFDTTQDTTLFDPLNFKFVSVEKKSKEQLSGMSRYNCKVKVKNRKYILPVFFNGDVTTNAEIVLISANGRYGLWDKKGGRFINEYSEFHENIRTSKDAAAILLSNR